VAMVGLMESMGGRGRCCGKDSAGHVESKIILSGQTKNWDTTVRSRILCWCSAWPGSPEVENSTAIVTSLASTAARVSGGRAEGFLEFFPCFCLGVR
jgi:hypothetical protein